MPFTSISKSTQRSVKVLIMFDVMEGDLPFLFGRPSLCTIGAFPNFKHKNLSLSIKRTVHRLELLHQSSHLRLPIVSTSCRQHVLRSNDEGTESTNKMRRSNANHYYKPMHLVKMDKESVGNQKENPEKSTLIRPKLLRRPDDKNNDTLRLEENPRTTWTCKSHQDDIIFKSSWSTDKFI